MPIVLPIAGVAIVSPLLVLPSGHCCWCCHCITVARAIVSLLLVPLCCCYWWPDKMKEVAAKMKEVAAKTKAALMPGLTTGGLHRHLG